MTIPRAESEGQAADRYDMDALAVALGVLGIPARVDMTGGGVATLSVGEVLWVDDDEVPRYVALVGPGTYGYGVSPSFGYWSETCIGPDDDGVSDVYIYWPDDAPKGVEYVAAYIAQRMDIYRAATVRGAGPVYQCGACGLAVDGVICRECRECPEPAGYWAFDEATARDYLITLERAAARERDPALSDAILAHHRVMRGALNLS